MISEDTKSTHHENNDKRFIWIESYTLWNTRLRKWKGKPRREENNSCNACVWDRTHSPKSREGLILLKKEQPNSSNGQKIWTALHKRFGTGPFAPKRCFAVHFRTRTLVSFSFVRLFWGGVLRTHVYQMPGSLHCLKRSFGPKESWACVGHVVLFFFRFRYLPFNGRAANNWGCVFC